MLCSTPALLRMAQYDDDMKSVDTFITIKNLLTDDGPAVLGVWHCGPAAEQ